MSMKTLHFLSALFHWNNAWCKNRAQGCCFFFFPALKSQRMNLTGRQSSPAGWELQVLVLPSLWNRVRSGPLVSGSSIAVPCKTRRSFRFLCPHFHSEPCGDRERERKWIAFVWWWDRTATRATWRKKSQQRQPLSPWGGKIQRWKYIQPTRTRLICNWSEPLYNICCKLKPITLLSNGNAIARPSLS